MSRSSSRNSFTALLVVTLAQFLALASPVGTQEPPQEVLVETKFSADDGIEGDNFGAAIAIDGDIMVVAAPWADVDDEDTSGIVYLYLRDPATGQWIQHQRLVPAQGHFEENFLDMALEVQGDTIVVGAPYARIDVLQEGAVYVFEPDQAGIWAETARLTDVAVGVAGHFGASLALNGDLLAIGAPEVSLDRHGRVGLFERDRGGPGNWGRITTLFGFANFVSSVEDAGHARAFGSSVAFTDDVLLVGASRASISYTNMHDGAVYVFRRSAIDLDQWDYVTRIFAPGADQCVGGIKLSMFLLESTGEERIEALRCAREDIHTSHDAFGETIAIDGNFLAIGAPSAEGEDDSTASGAVYVFQRDPINENQWNHVVTRTGRAESAFANLGQALALDGDRLIVGARGTTIDSRDNQGAVYVFERDVGGSDSWGEVERLIASDGLSNTFFGEAVALDSRTRLIGAIGDHEGRGAVYLHEATSLVELEDCQPAFEPTAELSDAGVVRHNSGTLLGTVAGTLPESLPVWIHEVEAPVEPLFSAAVPRGAYYNIGATCPSITPKNTPFALALPVPESADTSHLGVAVLAPPASILDGPTTDSVWHPVTGVYDVENQVYIITLAALWAEGSTVVLIEHPDLSPRQPSSAEPAALTATRQSTINPEFVVDCFGFPNTLECDSPEESAVAAALNLAYLKFKAHGFPDPYLKNTTARLDNVNPWAFSIQPTSQYYDIFIFKPPCPYLAEYRWDGEIDFCKSAQFWDRLHTSSHHELFHAVQAAYEKVREDAAHDYKDGQYDNAWVIEGTANTAVESATTIRREATYSFRRTNVPLDYPGFQPTPNEFYPYETQDFWVYLLRANNREYFLGKLDGFFQLGASTVAVADRIAQPDQAFLGSLGDEYWAWVKNQVAEKDFNFDGLLTNPCHMEPSLIGNAPADTITYPAQDHVFSALRPLQSEFVKVVFTEEISGETTGSVRIRAEGDNLKYKVYLVKDPNDDPWILGEEEGEKKECQDVPDGDEAGREFKQLPVGSTVYVLLSRVKYQKESIDPPFYKVEVIASD